MGPRRAAQRAGLAAAAAVLCVPAAAHAVAPGGPVADARPAIDRSAVPVAAPERVREARAALRRRAGGRLALATDPATGATRAVQRLDGALTAPAAGDRRTVARSWLRENRALYGLSVADIDALQVAASRTAGRAGITTVRFAQRVRGVEVFDGGLRVALDRGGRVLAATGTPVPDADVPSTVPTLDAAAARRALDAGVGATTPVRPAALTLFATRGGTRLAWRLLQRRDSTATYAAIVDATSGSVLLRQNLTKAAAPTRVFPNYPGAEDAPGTGPANVEEEVDLEALGYLPTGAATLSGPYARAFSDVDDDGHAGPGEEVGRTEAGDFVFPFVDAPCAGAELVARCTWDPSVTEDWRRNREQNAVQAFTLVNRFRDHLEKPEIGFGADGFADEDRVVVQSRDGAALDPPNLNNANMTVLPDGASPTMQMYLFSDPSYRRIDGGDDAATVWHEYAHGLTGRLVTHSDGTSALTSPHAGALGEAWSDFYALDLLHRRGHEVDDPAVDGEVDIGVYSDARPHATRSQGADCPVTGFDPVACPGGAAGAGGYTLGDFGDVGGAPEVHDDGEIWTQTLWDVRQALVAALMSEQAGSDLAEQLVTDSLRLLPPEPSFLDARNAMLAADTALGGAQRKLLWSVFATRGMGFYADVTGADDIQPTEDFTLPPAPGSTDTATTTPPPVVPPPGTPPTPTTLAPVVPPPATSSRGPAPTAGISRTGARGIRTRASCVRPCRITFKAVLGATTARRLNRERRTLFSRSGRVQTGTRLPTGTVTRATVTAARRAGMRTLAVTFTARVADGYGRVATRRLTVRFKV